MSDNADQMKLQMNFSFHRILSPITITNKWRMLHQILIVPDLRPFHALGRICREISAKSAILCMPRDSPSFCIQPSCRWTVSLLTYPLLPCWQAHKTFVCWTSLTCNMLCRGPAKWKQCPPTSHWLWVRCIIEVSSRIRMIFASYNAQRRQRGSLQLWCHRIVWPGESKPGYPAPECGMLPANTHGNRNK